jgi:hypothetical protein
VISTAPDESKRRKPSGSASGWRAVTKSTLALVVATASERSAKVEVPFSTGTPCFSHSTATLSSIVSGVAAFRSRIKRSATFRFRHYR